VVVFPTNYMMNIKRHAHINMYIEKNILYVRVYSDYPHSLEARTLGRSTEIEDLLGSVVDPVDNLIGSESWPNTRIFLGKKFHWEFF
jgi:hypothetical protein